MLPFPRQVAYYLAVPSTLERLYMDVAEGKLWKLSYSELAELCQELAHISAPHVDATLRDEARRLSGAGADALAINTHEEGGAARQAATAGALRKRTIELIMKSHQAEPG